MKKDEQIKERWDIIEMVGYNGHFRSLGETYSSLEEATAVVRKLNRSATVQTSFFVRDLINERTTMGNLERG